MMRLEVDGAARNLIYTSLTQKNNLGGIVTVLKGRNVDNPQRKLGVRDAITSLPPQRGATLLSCHAPLGR